MSRFLSAALICFAALSVTTPSLAQDAVVPSSEQAIDQLRACQAIAEPDARLACYDREVGAVVAATEQGTLQVVDRQDIEETRRGLFGFSLPRIRLFGGEEDQLTELETTITDVRREGREGWVFTTAEGSVWRIAETKMGWRPPQEGQPVMLKRAAMNSYFIRVNGQIGVKGRRIE